MSQRLVATSLLVATFLLSLLGVSPAVRAAEDFNGFIVDTAGAVPRKSSDHFTLHVDEYTTDEEARALAKVLLEEGPEAVIKALRKIEKGYIKIGSRLGYGLGFIRSIDAENGGRIIRAVTDRPIQMFELMRNTRSSDHEFGLLEIELDVKGSGKGQLIAAAEVTIKPDGTVEIESLGSRPFLLQSVKQRQPKAKKSGEPPTQ
jgi:hypothetical protein